METVLKKNRIPFYIWNKRDIKGMVTMESRQVRNVAELTVVISLSYFRQSMVANEAAGMAITAVLMLLMMGLTFIR